MEKSRTIVQLQKEELKQILDNAKEITQPSSFKIIDSKTTNNNFVTKEEFVRRLNLVNRKMIQA